MSNLRLFFALWPSDAVRAQLAPHAEAMARDYGGVATHPARFHLTLVFLDGLPAQFLPVFAACGEGIDVDGFSLRIDARAHFPHGVGWLGAINPPPQLAALQGLLETNVQNALGIRFPRPFNPHLTAVRRCRYFPPPRPIVPPIDWPVDRFVLVHSIIAPPHSRYEILKTWSLA